MASTGDKSTPSRGIGGYVRRVRFPDGYYYCNRDRCQDRDPERIVRTYVDGRGEMIEVQLKPEERDYARDPADGKRRPGVTDSVEGTPGASGNGSQLTTTVAAQDDETALYAEAKAEIMASKGLANYNQLETHYEHLLKTMIEQKVGNLRRKKAASSKSALPTANTSVDDVPHQSTSAQPPMQSLPQDMVAESMFHHQQVVDESQLRHATIGESRQGEFAVNTQPESGSQDNVGHLIGLVDLLGSVKLANITDPSYVGGDKFVERLAVDLGNLTDNTEDWARLHYLERDIDAIQIEYQQQGGVLLYEHQVKLGDIGKMLNEMRQRLTPPIRDDVAMGEAPPLERGDEQSLESHRQTCRNHMELMAKAMSDEYQGCNRLVKANFDKFTEEVWSVVEHFNPSSENGSSSRIEVYDDLCRQLTAYLDALPVYYSRLLTLSICELDIFVKEMHEAISSSKSIAALKSKMARIDEKKDYLISNTCRFVSNMFGLFVDFYMLYVQLVDQVASADHEATFYGLWHPVHLALMRMISLDEDASNARRPDSNRFLLYYNEYFGRGPEDERQHGNSSLQDMGSTQGVIDNHQIAQRSIQEDHMLGEAPEQRMILGQVEMPVQVVNRSLRLRSSQAPALEVAVVPAEHHGRSLMRQTKQIVGLKRSSSAEAPIAKKSSSLIRWQPDQSVAVQQRDIEQSEEEQDQETDLDIREPRDDDSMVFSGDE